MTQRTLYALILAGGSGTRLWPRSRARYPKQFLDLVGPRTMLQEALDRLLPLVPLDRILVATNREHVDPVVEQLPDLPSANLLAEPEGRGNAAAIGLAAIHLRRRDPEGIMGVVTADHLIGRPDVFREALRAAAEVAADDWLVTLGIQPIYPETGYGYVERAEPLAEVNGFAVYRVAHFVEKPPRAQAEEYLHSGRHSWNSGMFVWKVERILAEIARQMPDLAAGLDEIDAALGSPSAAATLERVWPRLPKQTIDYGIMEHAERVAVVPVDIAWSDVGSWATVFEVSSKDDQGNVVVGEHLGIDTVRSLIYSRDRLVATIGLEDFIVVDTGDAVLVCPKQRAQDVRHLVALLQERRRTDLL